MKDEPKMMDVELERITEVELYAWVGEDEHGSGVIGIKQAICPAGTIPIVSVSKEKAEQPYLLDQMHRMVNEYGKPRHLVKFVFQKIERTIEPD
jgi:hypothetical protein